MEIETHKLYDEVVGTILQNVLTESKLANDKIVLWDFQPDQATDRLYYYVACMVSDIYEKGIYLEMKFISFLKFKRQNRKRKNLHWVWRKHTKLPLECRTSIFVIMDHVRKFYDAELDLFDDIVKEYYEPENEEVKEEI